MIGQDAKLFAVTVELNVLDLTERFSVLNLELAGDSDLLILTSADVKDLDHIVLSNHSHVATLNIHKSDLALRLGHGNDLLDLTGETADLNLVALLVLND